MSLAYAKELRIEKSVNMRDWSKRPGKTNKDGSPLYFTEQAHKSECDVMQIIRRYDKTGLISHVSNIEAQFGDMTGIDFQTMQNKVLEAEESFAKLPSEIRKEFENSPAKLLEFMDNPDNREKAIELGLIRADWTEDTDGLGEHVKLGENKVKPVPGDSSKEENVSTNSDS